MCQYEEGLLTKSEKEQKSKWVVNQKPKPLI